MVASLQPSPFAFGQDLSRHTNIFQPPRSPSRTSMSPSQTTASDYFGPSARKRSRADSRPLPRRSNSSRTPQNPQMNARPWLQCPTPTEIAFSGETEHDHGYVNERYTLAGGFDTPSLKASLALQESYIQPEDYRSRRTREDAWQQQQVDTIMPLSGPLARERNGVARIRVGTAPAAAESKSWTGLAFGLVGKVFNFGTSVIRGFYAGGGQGFDIKGHETSATNPWQTMEECSTPLPGAWTDGDFMGDFEQDNFDSSPSSFRPPTKRRQTDKDAWVVVEESESMASQTASSPRFKFDASTRQTASRASSRRSLAPTPRRMPSYGSFASGSPANHTLSESRASLASTRTPQYRPSMQSYGAMLSPEAERFVKRQARQDKAADRAMSTMSRQLEDLIRQGQEALGTKVSIEGLDCGSEMDEGFVDE